MKTKLSAAILLLLLATTPVLEAGLLDGTSWNVQVVPTTDTEEKGVDRFSDVLTFTRGQLKSLKLSRHGIGKVPYSASGTIDFMNWSTQPMLRDKQSAEWGGTIKGSNIKGTLKWVTAEGRTLYFYVNGSKSR